MGRFAVLTIGVSRYLIKTHIVKIINNVLIWEIHKVIITNESFIERYA